MSSDPSFMELTLKHESLEELFLKHQEYLLAGDLSSAVLSLAEYREELMEHMTLEEEEIFRLYERVEAPPGGGIELFAAEHAKIRELLEQIESKLQTLTADLPSLPRQIIQLLDDESQLKRVMDHHDLRERRFLYPSVDQVATDSERSAILGSLVL